MYFVNYTGRTWEENDCCMFEKVRIRVSSILVVGSLVASQIYVDLRYASTSLGMKQRLYIYVVV